MSAQTASRLVRAVAPGEVRAVALDAADRPFHLFLERWGGVGEAAPYDSQHTARIRAFADDLNGAFIELDSGEEAFLRLKTKDGLTEGGAINVIVAAAARDGKLARVTRTDAVPEQSSAWARWVSRVSAGAALEIETNDDLVDAAFEDALATSVTLPGGGRLHIERTRALTAVDMDTAGRQGKGSAGARALSINKDAVVELARHASLKGLGGLLVLDCVGPLNKGAAEQVQRAAYAAFERFGCADYKVLKPSSLGLLQISLPWRDCPLADRLARDPDETDLLAQFRAVQRDGRANPATLYEVELSKTAWRAYQKRRKEADDALSETMSGRVTLSARETGESRIKKR